LDIPKSCAWVSRTWSESFMSPPIAPSTMPAWRRAASATACRSVVISSAARACGGLRMAWSVSRMSLMVPDGPATTVTARSADVATASISVSCCCISPTLANCWSTRCICDWNRSN
jgi:hypothetical protein